MKKQIALCLVLCLVLSLGAVQVFGADLYGNFSGSGTSDDPFLIQSEQDLVTLLDHTTDGDALSQYYLGADGTPKYFKFTRDLDMTDYPVTSYGIGISGAGWNTTPIKSHFDGGGYTISNLSMTNDAMFVGLFGQIEGGSVTNLTLDHFTLKSTNAACSRVGFLAADTRSGGSVQYCSVINSTLDVPVVDGMLVGGVVANNNGMMHVELSSYNNTYPDFSGKSVTFGSVLGGDVGNAIFGYSDLQPLVGGITAGQYCVVVNFSIGEHGKLLENGKQVFAASLPDKVSKTYTVVPDEGYLYTVKVNGSEVATDANHQFALTPSDGMEIEVSFTLKNPIQPGIAEDVTYIQQTTYNGLPAMIAYSKVNNFTTGEEGLEYGMKIWKGTDTDNTLVLPAYQSQTVKATAQPNAAFAIRVYGEAIEAGKTYSMQPYVGEVTGSAEEITLE